MNNEKTTLNVEILGKRYTVMCVEEQADDLIQAAQHLDTKMREIRQAKKVDGLDRIAVMAALNITHDLLTTRSQSLDYKETLEDKMLRLNATLAGAMITATLLLESDE